jgi:hypothetical protein
MKSLTPLGLAIWYLDDGCNRKETNFAQIATYNFNEAENYLMKNYLEKQFDLKVIVSKLRQYYFLKIQKDRLFEIVRPWGEEYMPYKVFSNEKLLQMKDDDIVCSA